MQKEEGESNKKDPLSMPQDTYTLLCSWGVSLPVVWEEEEEEAAATGVQIVAQRVLRMMEGKERFWRCQTRRCSSRCMTPTFTSRW